MCRGSEQYLQERDSDHRIEDLRAENETLEKEWKDLKVARKEADAAHDRFMSKESTRSLLYVSRKDIEELPSLQSAQILAVRVPPGSRLTVPQNQEDWQSRFVLHIRSDRGAIECSPISSTNIEGDAKCTAPYVAGIRSSDEEKPMVPNPLGFEHGVGSGSQSQGSAEHARYLGNVNPRVASSSLQSQSGLRDPNSARPGAHGGYGTLQHMNNSGLHSASTSLDHGDVRSGTATICVPALAGELWEQRAGRIANAPSAAAAAATTTTTAATTDVGGTMVRHVPACEGRFAPRPTTLKISIVCTDRGYGTGCLSSVTA
ncbi:hypothetical protein DFJ77DRAFT_212030 [Powellomyces hirtus]|nr:hypothetical protein DFJ77DRAFT_212030 [Powellomyces hirtus]